MNNITGTLVGFSFLSEFIGSLFLILLGNGVVALVNLKGSKGFKAGWASIAIGWGIAVFVGAILASYTGGHLNFAVSLGVFIQALGGHTAGNPFAPGFELMILVYLAAQFLGMFVGQVFVDLVYWLQIEKETDKDAILGLHSTAPAQKERTGKTYTLNFIAEMVATFVLILGVSAAGFFAGTNGTPGNPALGGPGMVAIIPGAIVAALVVMGIGFGLGGPTGFAINPTRDLAPRIVHAILPLKNKGGSDWAYSWVPLLAPLVGGALGGAMSLVYYL